MKYAVAVGLALLAACGGVDESAPVTGTGSGASTIQCAARTGIYRAAFAYRSGSCGPSFESNVNFSSTSGGTSGCTDHGSSATANRCSVSIDQTCPASTGKFDQVAKVDFSIDGTAGTGSESVTFYDSYGRVTCLGTYDLTFTKI